MGLVRRKSNWKSNWELETLGIEEKESTLYDQFKDKVKFNGTRYEVSLPWKDTVVNIPDNYQLSLRRLNSLMRRLKCEPSVLVEYDKIIQEQIKNGIVEVIDEHEPMKVDGDKIHYLPHHAVIRQDKETTKVRIVYDASAKENGPSLNECLHIGPKFNQSIFELLIRFRLHKCAFIADVEKAFLMIAINESDRDALRFLWFKDIWQDLPEIQILRFARVTFGVAPSPFLLNATIRWHLESHRDTHPEVVSKLMRSIYVDDVISGSSTIEENFQLYEQFRDILQEGGFNLRKFVTSNNVYSEPPGEWHKVLGINWNSSSEKLSMEFGPVREEANILAPTKRHIVSTISKIFDPIGIISPVTIKLKILLQDLHKAKINWNSYVTDELLKQWVDITTSISNSAPITINRYYFRDISGTKKEWRLHGFCDASTRAYAAVVYLQCITNDDQRVAFVASKTRVAPIKECSIPRLELLGALLLARLINTVARALEEEIVLKEPVFYTDSLVALYWIRGIGKSWKPFVENRVREIRKSTNVSSWRHCQGTENPADIPTRGLTPHELFNNEVCFNGLMRENTNVKK